MVARLIRLRLTYLLSFLQGDAKQVLKNLATIILGIISAVFIAWMPILLAGADPEFLFLLDSITAFIVITSAFVGPFFITRFNFDTRAFQWIPAKPASLAGSSLAASCFSFPFLWALLWLGSYTVLRKDFLNISAGLIVTYLVTLAVMLVGSRFSASVTQLLFDTQRRIKARNMLGVILALAIFPASIYFLVASVINKDIKFLNEVNEIIRFTPAGAPANLWHEFSAGETIPAVAGLLLLISFFFVLVGLTVSAMIRELNSVATPEMSQMGAVRLGWFDAFPAKPTGVIGARSVIYWLKDPRYLVSLIAIPVIPVAVVAILKFATVSVDVLAFLPLPLMLIMVAWMTHNDVAHDSTAFWLHVSSGIQGWQDRLGRLAPVFMIGLPILLIGSGTSVVISGDWKLLPSFFALGFAALCASAALSSVTSILLPYPATRPGESPFRQPQWHGAGAGFAQTLAFAGSVVLTGPAIWFVYAGAVAPTFEEQMLLMGAGVGYGLLLLALGVVIGGIIFNRRASDVLNQLQIFD